MGTLWDWLHVDATGLCTFFIGGEEWDSKLDKTVKIVPKAGENETLNCRNGLWTGIFISRPFGKDMAGRRWQEMLDCVVVIIGTLFD